MAFPTGFLVDSAETDTLLYKIYAPQCKYRISINFLRTPHDKMKTLKVCK